MRAVRQAANCLSPFSMLLLIYLRTRLALAHSIAHWLGGISGVLCVVVYLRQRGHVSRGVLSHRLSTLRSGQQVQEVAVRLQTAVARDVVCGDRRQPTTDSHYCIRKSPTKYSTYSTLKTANFITIRHQFFRLIIKMLILKKNFNDFDFTTFFLLRLTVDFLVALYT